MSRTSPLPVRIRRSRAPLHAAGRGVPGRRRSCTGRGDRFFLAAISIFVLLACGMARAEVALDWHTLPALPEALAGHFAGVHNGALIVAGGSRFSVSPWQGGAKEWKDAIYVLPRPDGEWIPAGTLPRARAYGVSASIESGLYLVGGTDGAHPFDDVLRLRWDGAALDVDAPFPNLHLPHAVAMGGGAVIGSTVYVAGGQVAAESTQALSTLYALDLAQEQAAWKELPPLPGAGRILAPVAVTGGKLYVFSGAELLAKDGQATRRYLNDAWAYTPGGAWQAIADVPTPMCAGAAASLGAAHLVVFGGDDGAHFARNAELGDAHPGFPKRAYVYHPITDTWVTVDGVPTGYVTTGAVAWDGAIVVPGGEDRPGHRGAQVFSATLPGPTNALGWLDHAVLALYFVVLVAMGYYFVGREHDTETFFLGGRKVPWWAVGISIFGTSLSAITYLTFPAKAFAADWTTALFNTGIVFVAPVVIVFYLPRLRATQLTTAYEFLERRFNVWARVYGSLVFFTFQVARISIILFLPSMVLSTATGLELYTCIVVTGVITTLYTVMGGIEAVIWTDVLQSVVLLFGAIYAFAAIVLRFDGSLATVLAEGAAADKFHMLNWSWDYTSATVWVCLVGSAFTNLYPATADQTMVQRYLTTATTREAGRAVALNAFLAIPATLIFFGLGTALWVFYRHHPEQLDPALPQDAILPLFVISHFPPGLTGLVIAGIFAASMSSLDSSLNSIASVVVHDGYRRIWPGIGERHALNVARWVTVVFGVFGTASAVLVAMRNSPTLFDVYFEMMGLVTGGLAGLMALGVFTKRANAWGALIGVAASAFCVYYVNVPTPIHRFLGLAPVYHILKAAIGCVVSFAVGYLASLLIPVKAKPLA